MNPIEGQGHQNTFQGFSLAKSKVKDEFGGLTYAYITTPGHTVTTAQRP